MLSLEDFKESSRQGMPCSIETILGSMDANDRQVLEQALAAPYTEVGHSTIERVLKANGYQVGTGAVGKHRRKTCRCA